MNRVIALFAAAAALLGLAAAGFLILGRPAADAFADCRGGAAPSGVATIGGPFVLTDPTGARVTDTDVITRPTLVYFGYGFCPDICPTDLARNALAADLLAERGIDVGQIFITIDPERDTPEALGAFAAFIHPDLVGLTGSPADVAAAAKAYRVYFARSGDDPEFYLMDHSTFTYLVAPETGFLEFFHSGIPAEDLAASVVCFVEGLGA